MRPGGLSRVSALAFFVEVSERGPMALALPLGLTSAGWTAVGSLATAAAALVALAALLYQWHGRRQDEASVIRTRLAAFASEMREFSRALPEGAPLVSAASHTADWLRDQAGRDATADQLRSLIAGGSAALPAAVEGWSAAPDARALRRRLNSLSSLADGFPGYLGLLVPTVTLLRILLGSGYSSSSFLGLLQGRAAQEFGAAHPDDTVDELRRAVAQHLRSYASQAFLEFGQPLVTDLVSFVTTIAGGFAELDSGKLLRLARVKAPLVNVAPVDEQGHELEQHALKELRVVVELVSSRVPPKLAVQVEDRLRVIEAAFAERWKIVYPAAGRR